MPPRKRARAAASTATIACNRSVILLKQSNAIGTIYEAGELCDGEVKLGQRTYPVSRMVLASASPFFKAAFSGTMREGVQQAVTLDATLSATAVEALLRFAHAPGPIAVPEDEVEDLIAAADLLNIVDAVPLIASQLVTSVTRENCLVRLGLAGRYDLDALAKVALETIDKHFADVAASDAFRQLPVEALTHLLKVDDMETTEETAIYEALLAWVAHDASRAAHFDSLFELVRLPHLGTAYLVSNVMHAPPVLASARAEQLVREAMLWITVPEQRDALASPRTVARRRYTDVRFVDCGEGVVLENDGKIVIRKGYAYWRGARADSLSLVQRSVWKLRLSPGARTEYLGEPLGFFLGVVKDGTMVPDDSVCPTRRGMVGAKITLAQTGDEFTISADPGRKTLTIEAELANGRTSVAFDDGQMAAREQHWPVEAGESWQPFVLMNLGGQHAQEANESRIEVVDP